MRVTPWLGRELNAPARATYPAPANHGCRSPKNSGEAPQSEPHRAFCPEKTRAASNRRRMCHYRHCPGEIMRLLTLLILRLMAVVLLCLTVAIGALVLEAHSSIESDVAATGARVNSHLQSLYWQHLVWRDGMT